MFITLIEYKYVESRKRREIIIDKGFVLELMSVAFISWVVSLASYKTEVEKGMMM